MDDTYSLPARHKLDVRTYHRMADAGIFADGNRIELIDGDLIDMAPIGQGHAATVNWLVEALFLACSGRAIVSPQNPVRLDQWSEPQPDLAVLRRRADFYATGERPGPADVILLVEVADMSLNFDRGVKLPLYARAGIAEFWIIDIARRVVDTYKTPRGDAYSEVTTYRPGDRVTLSVAPDIVVNLSWMFG